jgi:hypothetical protein
MSMVKTNWRCKQCGRPVAMHYDHVGDCGPNATEDDCSGTFSHPTRSTCDRRGVINLTHEMVEVRERTSAEEAEET